MNMKPIFDDHILLLHHLDFIISGCKKSTNNLTSRLLLIIFMFGYPMLRIRGYDACFPWRVYVIAHLVLLHSSLIVKTSQKGILFCQNHDLKIFSILATYLLLLKRKWKW